MQIGLCLDVVTDFDNVSVNPSSLKDHLKDPLSRKPELASASHGPPRPAGEGGLLRVAPAFRDADFGDFCVLEVSYFSSYRRNLKPRSTRWTEGMEARCRQRHQWTRRDLPLDRQSLQRPTKPSLTRCRKLYTNDERTIAGYLHRLRRILLYQSIGCV